MKKTLLSIVAIATLTTGAMADNKGIEISYDSLYNNLSKVEYRYSMVRQVCEGTVAGYQAEFGELEDDKEAFKDLKSIMHWTFEVLKQLNEGDESKIIVTTGYDNEGMTIIEDENREYFYFDSMESCLPMVDALKKLEH